MARRRQSARSSTNRFGSFCLVLQALVSVIFMIVVVLLDMLPLNYLALVAMILVFLWCIAFTSQAVRKKKGIAGKIYSLVLVCVLALGTFNIAEANNMLSMITGGNVRVDKMAVAVRADDPAETIEDAMDYNFGVQFQQGGDNIQTAVTKLQEELGTTLEVTECDSVQDQAQALINGQVDAIIYNEAYTELMEGSVDDFTHNTKIIYEMSIETKLDLGIGTDSSLTNEPFTVYISGIDTYGEVTETSRSDVNIIAVVNPKTHQILLITTPRDSYVPLYGPSSQIPEYSQGSLDKLTHAGVYGIETSMETLGKLYDTDINYYVRLNFTSLIDIVDILGGIDVDSEFAFTTGDESGAVVEVHEGTNHFDGKQALAFSRERHALEDGDNQRGKNQQAVITAMLKKVISPTMLLRASTLMNQVSKDVEMNVTQSQLNALIRNQLRTNADWTIQSVALSGEGGQDYCYSAPDQLLYVMYPDETELQKIIDLANVVEEGGTLPDGELLN
ncbi:MAG TPA: LCP family protein [Candidatus Mediterraneibacter gallistercoris]|uniref:LCP family protein n=1 Tax=Candidatus Mediterraneibacter gallistercoris TaxID=2838671 RepID=A0A9D2P8R1_9FIRM|nr:LCP family protein [Candidatus Mediterraneibacter gallistercoris]